MDALDERSERVERLALESLMAHCPAATREALGLFHEEVGDALVTGCANDSSILINRCLGLGTREPVTRERIEAIDAVYRRHGVKRYFLHVYPDALSEGGATFEGTRLEKTRGWMKFRRGLEPPLRRESSLQVRRVGPDRALDFGRCVATAFGMTEAAAPMLAGLADDPRWHLFVSYDGDAPAGAGSLFLEDGCAWFEWGATYPAFRQRGSQGAIMTARLEAALDAGVEAMFTETGEAVDGDPQHSYRNIERYGFTTSVLRENWAPPKA